MKRKGPFEIFGIPLDSEWDSSIKWNRVAGHLGSLAGKRVLETLILEGDGEMALFPQKRYAKMNNIFFIPTIACLTHWLTRSGFAHIRCVDVSRTTVKEQRKTKWVDTESLADFLDPEDPGKTVEGYPAPVRAMVLAIAGPR